LADRAAGERLKRDPVIPLRAALGARILRSCHLPRDDATEFPPLAARGARTHGTDDRRVGRAGPTLAAVVQRGLEAAVADPVVNGAARPGRSARLGRRERLRRWPQRTQRLPRRRRRG